MITETSSKLNHPDAESSAWLQVQPSLSGKAEPDYLALLARLAVNVIINERGRPDTDAETCALMLDAETLAQAFWIALRKEPGPCV